MDFITTKWQEVWRSSNEELVREHLDESSVDQGKFLKCHEDYWIGLQYLL